MEIDRGAPAIGEAEVRIDAPPERVWEVIAGLEDRPAWAPDIRSVRLEGPLAPGSVFRWRSGAVSLVSTLRVVDPPRGLAWTGRSMPAPRAGRSTARSGGGSRS